MPGLILPPRRLVAGSGIIITESGGAQVVNALTQLDDIAPAGLFIPDVSTWPSTTIKMPSRVGVPSRQRFLDVAEILIAGTAPAAGTTAGDCYALRFAGSIAGSQDVLMDDPATRRFAFDGISGSPAAWAIGSAGTPGTEFGYIGKFRLTGSVTGITALGYYQSNANTSGDSRVMFLLNEARTEVLATSIVYNDEIYSATSPSTVDDLIAHQLESAIDLTAGEYWIGVVQAAGAKSIKPQMTNYTGTGGAVAAPTSLVPCMKLQTQLGSPSDFLAGGAAVSAGSPNAGIKFALYGSPGGTEIDGDLTVSVVTNGTPPNVPTELNVRMTWLAVEE